MTMLTPQTSASSPVSVAAGAVIDATASRSAGNLDRRSAAITISELLEEIDDGYHDLNAKPWHTGFEVLDRTIGGGLFPGDMVILAGLPGVGKTVLSLQMARNLARAGTPVTYVCFEHESADLLRRLLVLEAREALLSTPRSVGGSWYRSEAVPDVLRHGRNSAPGGSGAAVGSLRPLSVLQEDPALGIARETMDTYAGHFTLVSARPGTGSMERITALAAAMQQSGAGVLFIDYLQKIEVNWESEIGSVSAALKDVAMRFGVSVVAVAAIDGSEMSHKRLHINHLSDRGSVAYDADTVLLMNDKFRIIHPTNRPETTAAIQQMHTTVVITVEKCRRAAAPSDVQLVKDFGSFRFESDSSFVQERLIAEE